MRREGSAFTGGMQALKPRGSPEKLRMDFPVEFFHAFRRWQASTDC
jgi:hypothetical protein